MKFRSEADGLEANELIVRQDDDRSAEFLKKMYHRMAVLGRIGVWECDLATERLTWSDIVYDLFDLPRHSVVSRAETLACYEPNSLRELERFRTEAIDKCSSFTVDVALRTGQGNSRWIRITGDIEQENGKAARIFGTKQDITQEMEALLKVQALQTQLIHTSRVSAIEAIRSTLAHELNQPLASLALYVSAMRKNLAGTMPSKITGEILDGLEECAIKAGQITRDIRKMPSLQRTDLTIFDLDVAIRQASSIALMGAPQDILVAYSGRSGMQALGDPVQIQQAVINLVRNACEALKGSARREIAISTEEIDGQAAIFIRDTGPGIEAEVLGTLFDSFVSTKPESTGIGLSISRTIIEGHSGKLTAQNNPDGGATFCFTLPAAPKGDRLA